MSSTNFTLLQDTTDWRADGILQARCKKGSIEAFKASLARIRSGYKIKDGDIKQVPEDIKKEKQEQIDVLIGKRAYLKGESEKLMDPASGAIPRKKQEIAEIQNFIASHLSPDIENRKHQSHPFSWADFLTYLLFLIPISLYLLLFYTSIAHTGFYGLDPASLFNGTNVSVPILPDFDDLLSALHTNYMLVLVPSVFFGFGLALHIFTDKIADDKMFILYAFILGLLTLCVDVLLAYKIHEQIRLALSLIIAESELADFISVYYQDPNFYIVLVMGFLVFMIWAIIFHALKVEWAKRNVVLNREKVIKRLEKEINKHQTDWAKYSSEINIINEEIDVLEKFQTADVVNFSTLKNYIDQFSDGWCDFLASVYQDEDELDRRISDVNFVKNEFILNLTLSSPKKINGYEKVQ